MTMTIYIARTSRSVAKRIWGARSRDQSRCVLKIMSFKVAFERWYGTCRLDINWQFVPDVWCGRLKSMQAKICFCWVGRKKQWIGWTEISGWYVMMEDGSKVAWGLWMYWFVCDGGNFEVYSGMNGEPMQTIEERTRQCHWGYQLNQIKFTDKYLKSPKLLWTKAFFYWHILCKLFEL